eukprot:2214014-Pleurochrysis_carterae.AAC.1
MDGAACELPCAMRVGSGPAREWQEGVVTLFDDSFEHEVWNETEMSRLVLIVDVWHPMLDTEQASVYSCLSDFLQSATSRSFVSRPLAAPSYLLARSRAHLFPTLNFCLHSCLTSSVFLLFLRPQISSSSGSAVSQSPLPLRQKDYQSFPGRTPPAFTRQETAREDPSPARASSEIERRDSDLFALLPLTSDRSRLSFYPTSPPSLPTRSPCNPPPHSHLCSPRSPSPSLRLPLLPSLPPLPRHPCPIAPKDGINVIHSEALADIQVPNAEFEVKIPDFPPHVVDPSTPHG